MNIRLARIDDLPAILAISNWAALNTPANFAVEPETLESWRQSFDATHRMYPWLVACGGDGVITGFAKASPHKGRCAYAWSAEISVYIHPDHHGKGIGRALYDRLIPMLREQGYTTLIAGITIPNPASQRLHESFGFTRAATFHRIGWKFSRWHDVGYWELVLRDGPPDAAPPKVQPVAIVWRRSWATDLRPPVVDRRLSAE